jgi:hypothetical protein
MAEKEPSPPHPSRPTRPQAFGLNSSPTGVWIRSPLKWSKDLSKSEPGTLMTAAGFAITGRHCARVNWTTTDQMWTLSAA